MPQYFGPSYGPTIGGSLAASQVEDSPPRGPKPGNSCALGAQKRVVHNVCWSSWPEAPREASILVDECQVERGSVDG